MSNVFDYSRFKTGERLSGILNRKMLTTRKKQAIIREYKVNDTDTGSSNIQIAMLSKRIKELTAHLKKHKKDVSSRRGLVGLVSKRRKHLKYLEKRNREAYESLIKKLGLKK